MEAPERGFRDVNSVCVVLAVAIVNFTLPKQLINWQRPPSKE
ncbi:protein of unknown function [Limnospira indica PCC 8005]|uniref:Uncharacterized protein n=1 Tax=Limnospira indica PCC 8005 TaxID=376219 RepID=A0A9P1KG96_9CYAN|nr:protein of unknown function [Limnospira indica PCC 8005]